MKSGAGAVLLALLCACAGPSPREQQETRFAQEGERARAVPERADAGAARAGLERALAFLVQSQNEDGSWASGAVEGLLDSHYSVASFYDWQVAACALAALALLRAEETADRRAALERSVSWLCDTRPPRRGSDWDNDTIWAALYGTVLCVELARDPRFSAPERRDAIDARGREFLAILVRNQVPAGGFGYYDDQPYSRRPKWATSFASALVIPALGEAERLGWLADARVRERTIAYVRRCRLPNGAYEYDLNPIPRAPAGEHINKIEGSLGRIQVCNWALFSAGDGSVTLDMVRAGLEHLYARHRFLDVARMRPIPHEAYYANAGYFYYFGHYYAAEAINLLPAAEREALHARLRPHILKTQRRDGSMCDFLGQRYLLVADTAFGALTLLAGPRPA
ncbi:MAG: hypothetical protein HY812_02685 [Planctomycetes bacterium]|nr:hypothetical protein [Planctomycetota bacterium]